MTTRTSPLYEIDPEGCRLFVRSATRKEILDLASNILETRIRRSETLENPNEAGGASYSIHARATTLSKRGLSRSGLGFYECRLDEGVASQHPTIDSALVQLLAMPFLESVPDKLSIEAAHGATEVPARGLQSRTMGRGELNTSFTSGCYSI